MTSNELFRGLLAAVAQHKTELNADHNAIHRAFLQVLREVQKPEISEELAIEDLIEIDYDPLYGQSAWFDRALTRAQRDRIISFPNPSYKTICIRIDEQTGKAVLKKLGVSSTIQHLADVFVGQLERGETVTGG